MHLFKAMCPVASLGPEFDELSKKYGLPPIDLRRFEVEPDILARLSARVARTIGAIPVAVAADGTLIVAVARPDDPALIAGLAAAIGHQTLTVVTPAEHLEAAVDRYYPPAPS